MIKLDPLGPQHAGRVTSLMDAEVCKLLEREPINQVSEALAYVYDFGSTQPVKFAITHPALGLVGVISFGRTKNEIAEVVLGYWIGRAYQGHGFATEAIRLLLLQLKKLQIQQVIAEVFPENSSSLRVLEKKGFSQYYNPSTEKPKLCFKLQLTTPANQLAAAS